MSWEPVADHLDRSGFRTNQYSHLYCGQKNNDPKNYTPRRAGTLKRCTWNSWPSCRATSFQRQRASVVYRHPGFRIRESSLWLLSLSVVLWKRTPYLIQVVEWSRLKPISTYFPRPLIGWEMVMWLTQNQWGFSEGILGNSHWLWNERDTWGLGLLQEEAVAPEEPSTEVGSEGHRPSPAQAGPPMDFPILWVSNFPFLRQPLRMGNFATYSPLWLQCLYPCLSLPLFVFYLKSNTYLF